MSEFAHEAFAIASADAPTVRTAEFSVSSHAITTWCAALQEENPIYLPTRGEEQVAPMSMLQTWAAPRTAEGKLRHPTVHARVREVARQHGLHSIVATNYELTQHADLKVGDVVTEHCWVDEVSEPKSTALGNGHFVTIAFRMLNQHAHLVGEVRARTFYYLPPESAPAARPRQAPEPLGSPETLEMTRTMIISGALASNDHEPVHHDHQVAQHQGLPDIIVSIVTTAGLVCAYTGRHWSIDQPRHLSLRLAAPVFPGDTLTFSGEADFAATVHSGIKTLVTHNRGLHCAATVANYRPSGRSRSST